MTTGRLTRATLIAVLSVPLAVLGSAAPAGAEDACLPGAPVTYVPGPGNAPITVPGCAHPDQGAPLSDPVRSQERIPAPEPAPIAPDRSAPRKPLRVAPPTPPAPVLRSTPKRSTPRERTPAERRAAMAQERTERRGALRMERGRARSNTERRSSMDQERSARRAAMERELRERRARLRGTR